MREIRLSGSEGGVAFNPTSLPLSTRRRVAQASRLNREWYPTGMLGRWSQRDTGSEIEPLMAPMTQMRNH